MKKSSFFLLLLLCSTLLFAQRRPATRQPQITKPTVQTEQPSGKWFGVVFSDFSYVVQEPQLFPNQGKGTAGKNSFDLNRVQIGYEYTFNRDFSTRVVIDPTDPLLVQEGSIEWTNIFPMHTFTFGKMQTTSGKTAEKIFGYRSLGAMLFNRKGYDPEFDLGVSFYGKFDPQGMMYYSLGAANGSGIMPDTNKIKKFSFNFGIAPDRANTVEVYADYENFLYGRSIINTKLIYGMSTRTFAFGIEGFYRMERKFAGTKDITPAGGSLFGWFEMTRGLRGVIRADVLDQDLNNDGPTVITLTTTDDVYREVYINAGLDYTPIPEVHLIPNVVYEKKMEKGKSAKWADKIEARLTAAVYFK